MAGDLDPATVVSTATRPRSSLLALAPLGLALAPAVMKFAEAPAAAATVDPPAQVSSFCIEKAEGAPIHFRYLGTGDVQDHLASGSPVQVLSHRQSWSHISYVLKNESVLGWVLSASIDACPGAASPSATPPSATPPSATPPSATPQKPPLSGGVAPAGTGDAPSGTAPAGCAGPLSVKFYDVGQALSVLLSLPDGRHVLVDTGERAKRCGAPCKTWSEHLLSGLQADVQDKKLATVWITHQHSDHLGNAPDILHGFEVGLFVDNGTNLDSSLVQDARTAASERNVKLRVVDPDHRDSPIASGSGVKFTPILPTQWVTDCEGSPNDCSIGLRVDYCSSSVLFTGDAEEAEEAELDTRGPVTLLQVGHHGSDTSSSAEFIKRTTPKYAVISSGKVDEGTNSGYCHPRLSTVEALSEELGGLKNGDVEAFDAAVKCKDPTHAQHWRDVSTSDHLWLTERDGDVELVTTGDGEFQRRAAH